jgi:hypothetical protein
MAICVPGKPGVKGDGWEVCLSSGEGRPGRERVGGESGEIGDCDELASGPGRSVSVESSST